MPKGFVARLHLLVLQESIDRDLDPANVIFRCIDGSAAFKYESLELLVEPFKKTRNRRRRLRQAPRPQVGNAARSKGNGGLRTVLLFRHRLADLRRSFSDYDFATSLLPDGQAGCWAFRLSAAQRLPLTASSYEIEFDLLASAVDAGLKGAFTKPLLMAERPRHSSASADPYGTSIRKLPFIERKLGIPAATLGCLEGICGTLRSITSPEHSPAWLRSGSQGVLRRRIRRIWSMSDGCRNSKK